MKIKRVLAREIFDSRGNPTVECEITLTDGHSVIASVPSGKSVGLHEAVELRDGTRLGGRGVSQAIASIEEVIAPVLIGREPSLFALDEQILQLDDSDNKNILGANATLAVSIAALRAQAHYEKMELFELVAGLIGADSVRLPFPLFNMINGGVHADNNLAIQEFMLIPIAAQSFRESMEHATMVFHTLSELLKKDNKRTCVGDEGGFAPMLNNEREALDYIMRALKHNKMEGQFYIALDVAASEFYNADTGLYHWHQDRLVSDQLIEYYQELIHEYPVYSIEDGLAQDDWQGWKGLTEQLGGKIQLVADDVTATNFNRIIKLIQNNCANGIIIKPNQVGTVSEAFQAIQIAQMYEYSVVVSHRSGETEDTFISDLAVGVSAGQIKAGGCSRSERLAKYNRLLRIEDILMLQFLDS